MEAMRKGLAVGTLISLTGFALVFWAVSRLLPMMPRLQASAWFHSATNVIVLFAFATGPLVSLRQHRRKANVAHRGRQPRHDSTAAGN
jgi:hypothetical protein